MPCGAGAPVYRTVIVFKTALQNFTLKGKSLLPVVQGGMGVGVSAHRLAGTVASFGAMGTISSVDQRRHPPDLMEQTSGKLRTKENIDAANLVALDREIKKALQLAKGQGMVAVIIMRAVSEYARSVRQACESGAHAVVVGAGLPLDLPDLTKEFSKVAIVPVLSDVRGISLLLKKWMRKNRLPDAIVIENPHHAAGHLGVAKADDLKKEGVYESPTVLEGTLQLFKDMGIESENIPLIVAGGVHQHEQVRDLLDQGASAVQLGTAFAVSQEGDAHINFKKTLAEARPEDTVVFNSTAGLPARRAYTVAGKLPCQAGSLTNHCQRASLHGRVRLPDQCGWRDGIDKHGQFCIDTQLAFALQGDIKRGLFFRSSEPLPFGSAIRPCANCWNTCLPACVWRPPRRSGVNFAVCGA